MNLRENKVKPKTITLSNYLHDYGRRVENFNVKKSILKSENTENNFFKISKITKKHRT
jgi:hypothetical protein